MKFNSLELQGKLNSEITNLVVLNDVDSTNKFIKSLQSKKILDLLNPIITNFLKNKSIKILLQKEKILFADDELDITKEILEQFNKKHKKIKFE